MADRDKRAAAPRSGHAAPVPGAARADPDRAVGLLAAAFLLSGAAGLVHEVVWARMMGLVFGATSLAVSTVLAAFMGGLALGSWWIGRRTTRIADRPRLYGWLEIGAGAAALLVPLLLEAIGPFYGWLWRLTHWSFAALSLVRLVVAGALLLGPTVIMGATLPLLADYLAGRSGRRLTPQWLYTVNLAGAVLGAGAGGFLLMPLVGLWGTILAGCALNVAAGIIALRLPREAAARGRADTAAVSAPEAPPSGRKAGPWPVAGRRMGLLAGAAFLSGATSLATQVAWTRVLVLVVGSTTYAFSTVLVVYLVALAAGSAWASRRGSRIGDVFPSLAASHLLMALGTLGAVFTVNALPALYLGLYRSWRPASLAGVVAMNAGVVSAVLMPSVLFAGTILPLALSGALPRDARGTGETVGGLYAINTTGAILGAVIGGFVLVPLLGSDATLVGAALAATAMGLALAFVGPRRRRLAPAAVAAAALVVLGAATRPEWHQKTLNAGLYETASLEGYVLESPDTVLYHREGPTASVMVVQKPGSSRALRINGRINASNGPNDMATQVLLAQLPLLASPRGEEVFIVGLGSGVTAGAALQSPVRRVTVVELEPAVVEAARYFLDVNHDPLGDPRLRLLQDDARHVLGASPDTYDIIISEPSNPWVPGVANLFTRDFFATARRRLREDGMFAQWVQTYQISHESYKVLLATFQSVFPEVAVFRSRGTDTILLGSQRPLRLDLRDLDRKFLDPAVRNENARIGVLRPEHLLACLYAGPDDVRSLVRGARLNTDRNMLVEFEAPRQMTGHPNVATGRILTWLDRTPPDALLTEPAGLLDDPARLQALADALTALRRSPDRYRRLLDQ